MQAISTTSLEKSKKRFKLSSVTPYLYMSPIVIFAIVFSYFPFLRTVAFSFSRVNRRGEILEFVGLDNFISVLGRDDFIISLQNTLTLTAMYVPLSLFIACGLALLANKKRSMSGAYEVMFTLPMAVSMASASLIFKVILNPTIGIVNSALGISFGWFQDTGYALIGILVLCLWIGLAFDFLLFLVALRAVPTQVVEAATVDGAGVFGRFFKIQLPLIMPTVFFLMCTNIILSMMTVTPILILTEGGPFRSTQTLVYSMFVFGYQSLNYSVAAVFSLTVFIITFTFVLLTFKMDRSIHYQ